MVEQEVESAIFIISFFLSSFPREIVGENAPF